MFSMILELQKWRYFSVSVNPWQNASGFSNSFSSASAVADVSPRDGRKGQNFTVSYLVGSLGLTAKLPESILKKVSSKGKGNPDSVLNLLRSHGFTDSQIFSIITDYPLLLIADAEKSIGSKLKFLQSRGASTSELIEIVSKVPKILGKKEGKTISRYYDFVKEIIEADKSSNYEKLCQSLQGEGSPQDNKIRNVLVLRELGVPQKLLFSLIFSNSDACCGKEKFEESLKKVVELGFDPKTSKFVNALKVVYGMNDKAIEERVNAYRRLGFGVDDVWAMFKKHPICLALSEKKILNSFETFIGLGISRDEFLMMVKHYPTCLNYSVESVKKKIELLVKKMNWPLEAVTLFPQVLSYSMEKRIVPRCNVIEALMSKGLLKGNKLPPMGCVFTCTDKDFLNRYVRKHDDDMELVAELMSMFKNYPMFPGLSEKKILSSTETYLSLGFSRDEVTMMVKRFPQCLKCSAEKVKQKTEFLVKKMNWPLKAVVSNPVILGLSMEKRILPRCNVIKALLSKGLLGDKSELPAMSSVLKSSNQTFLNRYVRKHDDKELVAELMVVFTRDYNT